MALADSNVEIEFPLESVDACASARQAKPPKLTLVKRFSMMLQTPRKRHRGSHTPRAGRLARKLGDKSAVATKSANLSYNSRSWYWTFKTLFNLRQKGLFVLVPWFMLTLLAALSAALNKQLLGEWYDEGYAMPTTVPVALGSTMSLLLAFRLNIAYKRWWEARLLWGALINGARSLLTQLSACAPAAEGMPPTPSPRGLGQEPSTTATPLQQVGGWCIGLAVALQHHLRGQKVPVTRDGDGGLDPMAAAAKRQAGRTGPADKSTGAGAAASAAPQCEHRGRLRELDHLATGAVDYGGMHILLSPSQLQHMGQSRHPPLYALSRLRHTVELCLENSRVRRRGGGGGGGGGVGLGGNIGLELHLLQTTESMLGAITGCERIMRTPCPPGYVGVLRAALLLWLGILPYSLIELGWGVVPVISLLAIVLLEVEELAVQIESPFGVEPNDLPLEAYVLTVQADVLRILDEDQAPAVLDQMGGSVVGLDEGSVLAESTATGLPLTDSVPAMGGEA